MIELQNIRKVFNEGRPNEYIALHDLSLTIAAHQVTALNGPSGSGKTTLLSLLGCMARPTAGRIVLQGREITSLPERFLTDIRRKTFGFIFQQFNLLNGISVIENVMLPAYPLGEPFAALKQQALGLLELFNLAHKAAAKVEWLSGGKPREPPLPGPWLTTPRSLLPMNLPPTWIPGCPGNSWTLCAILKPRGKPSSSPAMTPWCTNPRSSTAWCGCETAA